MANLKRKRGHNGISAVGLQANKDGKAVREEGAVEEGDRDHVFTSAAGSMETRPGAVLF